MNTNTKQLTGTTDLWTLMNYWTILIVAMLGFLAGMAMTAHAEVLCRPKNGVTVRVRTACKKQEVQLNPVALGLQGPTGPTGPQGVQGIAGPTGMDGLNAEVLHLFDANDQDLGILLNTSAEVSDFITYHPTGDIVLHFSQSLTTVILSGGGSGNIVFLQANCAGPPYSVGAVYPSMLRYIHGQARAFTWVSDPPLTTSTLSKLENTGCVNEVTNQTVYPVQEITLPFSLPLAAPLTIGLAP